MAPAASPMAVPISAVDMADKLEGAEGVVGESTTLRVAVVFPACPSWTGRGPPSPGRQLGLSDPVGALGIRAGGSDLHQGGAGLAGHRDGLAQLVLTDPRVLGDLREGVSEVPISTSVGMMEVR